MLFGAHVSVAGGYLKALDYAESVGCECMQIFAKSPRQWRGPRIDEHAASEFIATRAARGFGPVFSHTAYLINLATDHVELRQRSITALADELIRGAVLGVAGVVTHVGNDPLGDPAAAAARVASGIIKAVGIAESVGGSARLLLENTAGAGSGFGGSIAQLAECISLTELPSERLGVCLDSCHGFAYGMALDTAEGWDEVTEAIRATMGLDRLGLIHANDCKFERGSHRDRHAWIGDGFVGESGFAAMVCHPSLAAVVACTEMSGDVPEKDVVNIERLKALRAQC